jgi:hypothetical protein
MRNQWTTFFFTAMCLPLCGSLSLLDLVCLELCLEELSTCLPVGGILEGREVLPFGRWCQSAFFGVFKRKKNLRCYEDLESSMEDILAMFFHTIYLWTVAFLSPSIA